MQTSAAPAPVPAASSRLQRLWARIGPQRARFWGVVVPIHLGAFVVLYFGTFGLLEAGYSRAGASAAAFQLDQAVRDMPFLVQASRATGNPHVFAHLMAVHQPIGLRLYGRDARQLSARNVSPDPEETRRVRQFLDVSRSENETWVEHRGGRDWVRGIVRIRADASCLPCHATGTILGAGTMKIDFTEPLRDIRGTLRFRVGLLLFAWVSLLFALTIVVQRTVSRSSARLRADLDAAASGRDSSEELRPLPLDPATAEVHRSLREFLRRQHERQTQVVSRLAHVDQLASLGQLAAGLAHEIKNPLAGIQGALELLREEAPEDTRKLYGEMLEELSRVHGILQRLLESGRPAPLRLARTDLAKLLQDTGELLRPSLRRRAVQLTVETAALPPVQVDPAKIRQVIVNLVQNAGEAMSERGGGHVTVRASAFPDAATGRGAVVIAVEDDGPGIPPDALPHLFEPFFTTKFTGTGLGLAISKSLVAQHGGRIEVSSDPGRGTSFLLFLPQLPADDVAAGGEIASA